MKLHRLSVRHFKCVERATIEFGPGLNVLYGQNDIGKSTLALAVRAALLLQHSSSAATALHCWVGGDSPSVDLTFSTGSNAYWRVAKTFGQPGTSVLRSSKDNTTYEQEAAARDVDGKLRALLRWGIKPPGGRGGAKGLPESFMSHALLGEQVSITKLFEMSLEEDGDDTARETLEAALQALAQDSLFKHVLEQAIARVDEAFTATGRPKTGRNSPFKKIGDEIRRLGDEVDRCQQEVEKSDLARDRLQTLNVELADALEANEVAKRELAGVRERVALTRAVSEAEARLGVAQQRVGEIDAAKADLSREITALADLEERLAEHTTERARLVAATTAAAASLKEAEAVLEHANSQDSEQQRALAQARAERDVSQLTREIAASEAQLEARRAEDTAEVKLREVAEECAIVATKVAAAETARELADARLVAAKQDVESARGLAILAAISDARERVETSQRAVEERDALLELARSADEEAAVLRARIEAAPLPSAEVSACLTRLAQEIEVALARVDVGVALRIEPLRKLGLTVSADGREATTVASSEPTDLEAGRELIVAIDGVARMRVTAGGASDRETLAGLQARWKEEAVPTLSSAGVEDVTALAAAVAERADWTRELEQLELQAKNARGNAEAKGDVETRLASEEKRLAERLASVSAERRAELESLTETLPADWAASLDERLRRAEARAESATKEVDAARTTIADLSNELATLRERESSAKATVDAYGQDNASEDAPTMSELEVTLDRLRSDLAMAQAEVQALAEAGSREVAAAQDAVDIAREALTNCRLAQTVGERKATEGHDAVVAAKARLEENRSRVAAMDEAAARAAVAGIESELAALPRPDPPVGEEDENNAVARADESAGAVARLRAEVANAEGAFQQVGGEVAREALVAAKAAREHAKKREAEVELDYNAYRLLAETLREVENTDGEHLGVVLGKEVSDRFQDLTDDRYGAVDLDANLKTSGVHIAGAARDFGDLSAGTQDQLATVLRICIAEQLDSTLVLDDHLSQTHRRRAEWFSRMLAAAADKIQIIVLTARPTDYLSPEQMEGDAESQDFAGGGVRAINLDRAITRVSYT